MNSSAISHPAGWRGMQDGASARLISGALFSALLWLAASASQAAVIAFEVRYTLNYYPPNPCAETSVGGAALERSTLSGLLSVFYRDADGNPVGLASADLDGHACGSRVDGVLEFSLDSSALPSSLLASFGGSIRVPDPGPPELPLFAFASPGTRVGTLTMAASQIPEPATLLLGLSGLAGLWATRRSRSLRMR